MSGANEPAEPIDLDGLEEQALSKDGETVMVERAWLKRVHEELSAGREAAAVLGRTFSGVKL